MQNFAVNIGGVNYIAGQVTSFDGLIDFDPISPYIGVGWGNSTKTKGWSFSVDAGILYYGDANVEMNVGCGTANCDQLRLDVEREKQELLDELDYKIYPVISVGVTYTF